MAKMTQSDVNQRKQWHPTPVLLSGKSHGRRSLVGRSPWGHEELDMTEWLHFHFSLSCIGEGNGNPLQCSCLENPRDGGPCWAAQSWTRLKQFSTYACIYVYMHMYVLCIHTYMRFHIYVLIWRRQWKPTPVLLPGKSHGGRSLVGCSPWGR